MKPLLPKSTLLIVVDVQERLVSVMPQPRMTDLLRAADILLGAARDLHAPVLVTEQYPAGLGPTVNALIGPLEAAGARRLEKTRFSAVGEPGLDSILEASRASAAVVLGMETHVCVFQTARDLTTRGIETYVVVDGVCSRREDHRETGLGLCQRAGAVLTTAESVVFDWLGDAAHPSFKALSKLVR